MRYLLLIRHGESLWNQKNLFTGWVDVPLSKQGIREALEAGNILASFTIDRVYVSSLIRSQMTALIALSEHPSGKVPIFCHRPESRESQWGTIYGEQAQRERIPVEIAWQLNERMYGELQGLNKEETQQKYGEEQVALWRRSYASSPPSGESLAMTAERTLPYFHKEILPRLRKETLLVCAHGNSLRSILMELDQLSQEQVVSLELRTGVPLIYTYQEEKLCRLST